MTIRKLQNQDWLIYKNIRLEALRVAPKSFGTKYRDLASMESTYWQRQIENCDNIFLVAFVEQEPIGLLKIVLNDNEINAQYAYIGSLYVKEKFRRKGIATQLISYAENYLKNETDLLGGVLEVNKSLQSAISLYKKLGYEIIKTNADEFVLTKKYR